MSAAFKVGDRITRPEWDADEWLKVEWLRSGSFAGVNSYGNPYQGYVRGGWSLWSHPPVRKTWLITTEHRAPGAGEAFMLNGSLVSTQYGSGIVRDVVVSVEEQS